jgi:hypothetical protein
VVAVESADQAGGCKGHKIIITHFTPPWVIIVHMKFHYMVVIEVPDEWAPPASRFECVRRLAQMVQNRVGPMMDELPVKPDFTNSITVVSFGESLNTSPDSSLPLKSARWWLKPIPVFEEPIPLHVVVCVFLLLLIGWLLGIPNKR